MLRARPTFHQPFINLVSKIFGRLAHQTPWFATPVLVQLPKNQVFATPGRFGVVPKKPGLGFPTCYYSINPPIKPQTYNFPKK